jgi:hypothetical protein
MPPRRTLNVLYYAPPLAVSVIGISRLWRATQLDGEAAQEVFIVGLLLLVCAVLFVAARKARVRSWRDEAWESSQQGQGKRLRRLEEEQAALRQDVHSRLASKTWLETFDRIEAHKDQGWVHLNRPDR